VQIGIHPGLEDANAPELVELRGLRFVAEGAGDQDIEVRVPGLAGGCDQIGARGCR